MQPKTSREEWQKRVERWRDSGLTAEQFASEFGINAGTLKFWGYKLGRESREAASPRVPRRRRAAAQSFVERVHWRDLDTGWIPLYAYLDQSSPSVSDLLEFGSPRIHSWLRSLDWSRN